MRASACALAHMGLRPAYLVVAVAVLLITSPTARAVGKSEVYIEDTDRFPGWKGELPKAELAGPTLGYGESGEVLLL